jgi:flagellar motility protein MotE (MotC chaperone)
VTEAFADDTDAYGAEADIEPEPESEVQPLKFAAPPSMALEHSIVPKGNWSPIVTGALGDDGARRDAVADQKQIAQQGEQSEKPAPALNAAPSEKAAEAPSGAVPNGGQQPDAAQGWKTSQHPENPAPAARSATTPDEPGFAAAPPPATAPPPKPLEALPPDATPAQQYCFNTTDSAADARFAWQAKKITEMEGELEKRSAALEAKTEEFKTWLARRDDFSKRAQEKLVGFYTRMRPDAAALQLAEMDEETAAAVLTKLEVKAASAVMSEMEPTRAAKIASIISGAARVPPARKAPVAAAPASQGEGSAPAPPSGTKS